MGMRSSFVNGFGFCTRNITDEKILKFIRNHIDTIKSYNSIHNEAINIIKNIRDDDIEALKNISESFFNATEFEDEYEYICDALYKISEYDVCCDRCLDVIAGIIGSELGINLSYQMAEDDCIGEPCILLEQAMPWQFNDTERNMTQDDLRNAFQKYIIELGIEDEDSDYLEVEYYG